MSQKTMFSQTEFMKRLVLLYRHTFHLDKFPTTTKKSSAGTLLEYAGTWAGNDLGDCLQEVFQSRGEAHF